MSCGLSHLTSVEPAAVELRDRDGLHDLVLENVNRSVLDMIQAAVKCTAAFCLAVTADLCQQRLAGTQIVHGVRSPLVAHQISRVWPAAKDRDARGWTGDVLDGHDRLLATSYSTDDIAVSIGVARRAGQPAFEPSDRDRLERMVPVIVQHYALHLQCLEYQRRELVLRALGKVSDASCVVDLAAGRVAWLFDAVAGQPCARVVLSDDQEVVRLVAGERAAGGIERLVGRRAVGATVISGVADLGRAPEFGDAPCVALGLTPIDAGRVPLSAREREVARLLVEGYSVLNAAAILSISENSIRTYVRRLYRKLDVTNRADLTRKCIALGPRAVCIAS